MKEVIALNDDVSINLPKLIPSKAFVYANSGYGKSWLCRRILEQSFGKIQQFVIDPEGEFSTLREKYDYVLIGKGCDIVADPKSAALLAHRLLREKVSAIIDLYELEPEERDMFVANFTRALVNAPKDLWHPYLCLFDEAQDFAPEKGNTLSCAPLLSLAKKGRKRGCCPIFATQRVSDISKSVIAACNNKLIGQASLDIDMKRCAAELGFTTREQMLSLRDLDPGEFFVFGPAISKTIQKTKIGPVFTTHPDSSKIGGKVGALKVVPASPKVKRALAALADLPAAAAEEAKTMGELRIQLSVARRQITQLSEAGEKNAPKLSDKEIRALLRPMLDPIQAKIEEWRKYGKKLEAIIMAGAENAKELRAPADIPAQQIVSNAVAHVKDTSMPKANTPTAILKPAPATVVEPQMQESLESNTEIGGISAAEQRILNSIAWMFSIGVSHPENPVVAFLSGYTNPRSGGYTEPRAALLKKGLIQYIDNGIALNQSGRQLAKWPDQPGTLEELHRTVLAKLTDAQHRILSPLLETRGKVIPNEELSKTAGYNNPRSGGYTEPRGDLRAYGLVEYVNGGVRAAGILFPENL